MKTIKTSKRVPSPRERARVRVWHKAFTLAEVLITIAIIGVVAALTIPTLLTNVTDRQFRSGHNSFQRKFGEALRVMNTQNELGGYANTKDFVTALSKHIKVLKTCENSLKDCFPEKFTFNNEEFETKDLMTSSDLGKDWGSKVMGVQFVNGVSALIAYNPACAADQYNNELIKISGNASSRNNATVQINFGTESGKECVALLYDVNSSTKPNVSAKDISDVGNVTLKTKPCKGVETGKVCPVEPFTPTPINCATTDDATRTAYCGQNTTGDWDDYWAGAKRYCEKELKMEQL